MFPSLNAFIIRSIILRFLVFLMVRIFFDIYREFPPKKMGNFCFDSPLLAIEQGELERDFDPIIAKPAKMITIIIG